MTRSHFTPRRAAWFDPPRIAAPALLRDLVVSAVLVLLLPSVAAAQASDPKLWVTDGPVHASAILADTLYIGGSFSRVQPVT